MRCCCSKEAELRIFRTFFNKITDVPMSIPESESRRDELMSSTHKNTPALSLCSYMNHKNKKKKKKRHFTCCMHEWNNHSDIIMCVYKY